uniref:Uncharacterized protein n=1 Tax=Arundo donax TaxID=35708 RepID=A0A0A8Y8H9_ARUDO
MVAMICLSWQLICCISVCWRAIATI